MKTLLKAAAFAVGLLGATSAMAASALVTTDLNVRTGPSTRYPAIGVLPNGAIVDVVGCTAGYSWCRVNYGGLDGWASASYLAQESGRYAGSDFGNVAATIGIPLIAGVIIGNALDDDDDYWRHRHWRDRDHWRYRDYDRWDGPRRVWRDRDNDDWRAERLRDRARAANRIDRRFERRWIPNPLSGTDPGETRFSSGR